MSGKKILAGIFAVVILLKVIVGLANPGGWTGLANVFLEHQVILIAVYLGLLLITGYYIFTSLDFIDVAVVMFFTSILVGLSVIPYWASLPRLQAEIVTAGFGKAWLSLVIWVFIAVAVLYRLFSGKK